jgi:hypothetical protein
MSSDMCIYANIYVYVNYTLEKIHGGAAITSEAEEISLLNFFGR